MPQVRLVARCYPTEERDKVANAIRAFFPDAVVEGDDPVVAVSGSVESFAEQLRDQRIRDAARAVLRRGIRGNQTSFRLNKQVAAIGKISFSDEHHPLGDIEVTISSDDIESLVGEIAPDTRAKRAMP